MATTTTYHSLRKPDLTDTFDLTQDLNNNWDKIDTALKNIDPNDSRLSGDGLKDPLKKDSQLTVQTDAGGIYLEPRGGHTNVGEFPSFDDESGTTGLRIYGRDDGSAGPVVKFTSMFDEGSVPSALPTGAADRINYNQGTILIDFTPNWDGDDGKYHYVFNNFVDASNRVTVVKATNNYLSVFVNGVSAGYLATSIQSGKTYRLVATWDVGSPIKLFFGESLNNDPEATSLNVPDPSSPPAVSSLLSYNTAGSRSADSVIHRLTIWDIPLDPTDDIAAKLSTPSDDPSSVHPEHIISGFDFTGLTAGELAVSGTNYGFCSQRTEVIDNIALNGTDTDITVGSTSGFSVGDLVCVWDDDTTPYAAVTSVTAISGNVITVSGDHTALAGNRFISKNLLANPDFEEGTVYWSQFNTPTTFEVDSNAKTNSSALHVIADAGYEGGYQDLSVTSGASYTLRGWGRVASGQLRLRAYDISGGSDIVYLTTTSSDWEQLEMTFEAPSSSLRVYVDSYGSAGEFRGDTLQLVENLVANPGFESAIGSEWQVTNGTLSQSNAQAHSGTYSGAFTGTVYQTINVSPEPLYYEVVAWLRTETGTATGVLAIYNEGFTNQRGIDFTVGSSWTRVSLVAQHSKSLLTIGISVTSNPGTVYIDDVTVRPIYDVPLQIIPDQVDQNVGGTLKVYDGGSTPVEIGRGSTDADITYIALQDSSGTAWYIYPDGSGGLTVSTTKP